VQRYFVNLLIKDLEAEKDMVTISYETNYLDEIVSTLTQCSKGLSKVQEERDKDRYKVIWERDKN